MYIREIWNLPVIQNQQILCISKLRSISYLANNKTHRQSYLMSCLQFEWITGWPELFLCSLKIWDNSYFDIIYKYNFHNVFYTSFENILSYNFVGISMFRTNFFFSCFYFVLYLSFIQYLIVVVLHISENVKFIVIWFNCVLGCSNFTLVFIHLSSCQCNSPCLWIGTFKSHPQQNLQLCHGA